MKELGERLVILLMAATLLLGVLVGWFGAFVEAELASEYLLYGGLGVVFVAILVGVWWGFDVVD